MHRQMGHPPLAESLLPETLGQNQRLTRIREAVNWARLGRLSIGGGSLLRPREPQVFVAIVRLR